MKILVIDDDPATQTVLNRILSVQGYEVILADNGNDGLAQALRHHPAMIICDWNMPGLTGLEVCQKIKATPELSTTFFVFLTNRTSVKDRVEGLDAGADDFVCKPVENTELRARVRSGLRLHQLSHDLKRQKQLLEAELSEAADYVCSILPQPLQHSCLDIDLSFIPSSKLGGDSIDYYWLDSEHLALYLLDVSGHGLRSALLSVSILNLLRTKGLNRVNFYRPAEVLQGLNKGFPMSDRHGQYFTIWYGVYHTRKRHLVYASAGHPPAILLWRDSKGTLASANLKTPGLPIGTFEDAKYQDASCQIPTDSFLYVFSDGIYEITERDGNIWGLNKFIELLKTQGQTQKNLTELLAKISHLNFKEFFDDDLSIIQVNFHA